MAIVGRQEFWVTGSRFYFKREDVAGVEQPTIDLGRIEVLSPNVAPETIKLEDSDGGIKHTVFETLTKIEETYSIVTSNLNQEVLALLFQADEIESFQQVAANKVVQHYAHPNSLVKIHDDDADDTYLYQIKVVAGVMTAVADLSTVGITAINATTNVITTASDVSSDLDAGEAIIIKPDGLANKLNAGTYIIVSATGTAVTVNGPFVAAESSITGTMIYKADSGDSGTIYKKDVDWDVVSLERGLISMLNDGAFTAAANVEIVFAVDTIAEGKRLLRPQTSAGSIKGKGIIVWGKGNNEEVDIREFLCSITPGGAALSDSDVSNVTLNVTVTSDLTSSTPAGRLLKTKGNLSEYSNIV